LNHFYRLQSDARFRINISMSDVNLSIPSALPISAAAVALDTLSHAQLRRRELGERYISSSMGDQIVMEVRTPHFHNGWSRKYVANIVEIDGEIILDGKLVAAKDLNTFGKFFAGLSVFTGCYGLAQAPTHMLEVLTVGGSIVIIIAWAVLVSVGNWFADRDIAFLYKELYGALNPGVK
jgi:hypothetical protein